MTEAPRQILITGANGFVGQKLAAAILSAPPFAEARLVLTDLKPPADLTASDGTRFVAADLCDEKQLDDLFDGDIDLIYHLAGVMGGAAEANYQLSRSVNVDATLNLLAKVRNDAKPPRVVFASSIAIFGPPLPEMIDDDTLPLPTMTYGAQKRMMEVAIEQFSARGWIDGLALRLPGIVARPDADARLKSAFLNTIFYDFAAGRDITLPIGPDGTTWLLSVSACIEAFMHAGLLDRALLGRRRAFTLPTQNVRIRDLVSALGEHFPDSQTRITYQPDAGIEAQFARQPDVKTSIADALGFRHDGSLATLIKRAFQEGLPADAQGRRID